MDVVVVVYNLVRVSIKGVASQPQVSVGESKKDEQMIFAGWHMTCSKASAQLSQMVLVWMTHPNLFHYSRKKAS